MNVVGRIRQFARTLGPGLITGASDDDPSGIATYSISGASAGYSMLWVALITTPMMAVIGGVCARIGVVTGAGLMRTLAKSMPRPFALALGIAVVAANTFNIGADIAAMGASANLLVRLPIEVWIVGFAVLIVLVEVFFSYRQFANVLKWLCASLLAYVVTAFIVHPPWPAVLWNTIVPHVSLNGAWLTTLTASLGTTITPYLFFWQSSMSVEEKNDRQAGDPARRAGATASQVRASHFDVNAGAIYSNLIMFFIIVTSAATIGVSGSTSIATAQDAALALRPLAGPFAYMLFALGIVGTGLLAVPVLAGSSAHVAAELYGFQEGLAQKPTRAKGYYGMIVFGILAGMIMGVLHVDPIRALFWSAVLNGLAAIPLVYALIRVARDARVLGQWTASRPAMVWLWITFAVMLASAAGMFASWFVHPVGA